MEKINIGIIGGGLMGREAASAFGRWFALTDFPVKAELIAVCDVNEKNTGNGIKPGPFDKTIDNKL